MAMLQEIPEFVNFVLPCPGGGMADAEDLKSSGVVWVSPVLTGLNNLQSYIYIGPSCSYVLVRARDRRAVSTDKYKREFYCSWF
jgi:hypothetical protein